MRTAVAYRVRTLSTGDALAIAGTSLLACVALLNLGGLGPGELRYLVVLPLPLAALALMARTRLSELQQWCLGVCAIASTAAIFARLADGVGQYAVALPVVALGLMFASRRPVACTVSAFFLTGAFGTFQAYAGFPTAPIVDWLLTSLWLAVIIAWLSGGRQRAAWLWPGVALLATYVVLTGIEVLAARTVNIGLESFRASTWYMAAALLVAFAPWPDSVRPRLVKGLLGATLLVGAYATFRWIVGPSGKEEEVARLFFNNFLDGELRPTGSFETAKQLAAWTAGTAPFCFALALALRGRWQLIAIAATGFLCLAMLACDVRAAPASAAPGAALVLVLYAVSPAFGARRIAVTVVAGTLAIAGATGGFVLTLGDKTDTKQRYEAILNPSQDESYQGRLYKWRTAYADMEKHPFGQGLGVAGRTQEQFGTYVNVASYALDNSYLKIGLEQGFAVMVLFGVMLATLLLGLVMRAFVTLDPVGAALIIGAAGVLASMSILFFIGNYVEGLTALAGWLLVGLGLRETVWRRPDTETT